MSVHPTSAAIGSWMSQGTLPIKDVSALKDMIFQLHHPIYLLEQHGQYAMASHGLVTLGNGQPSAGAYPLLGYAPACSLKNLGDPGFCTDYGVEYPYLAGSMAHGITSVAIVEEMGKHGMLGFFGAAGMSLAAVEDAIDRISTALGERPYGCNLIHSLNEPELEAALVDLYLRRGVKLVEASAFLGLTLPVVRYRVHGIHRDPSGNIVTPNRIIAKVSRVEVAIHFFSPPPDRFLRQLVANGDISSEQAELASRIPMAQDLTAEADSGGHTDNRPAITLFPTMVTLRDRMQQQYAYAQPLRVGAAGGIATPISAAAAFAMGAAYILTGSVNQACVESGTSDIVRQMLAEAGQADVIMAPAADMFEMGVKVQVLKRGTMFAMRGARLYEFYRKYGDIDQIPQADREILEQKFFKDSLENVWRRTQSYFQERDPSQLERAQREPKHKMALIFRSYLGLASHWANRGEPDRKLDYQIWCGPAMGAFNEWVKGSFLESPEHRQVIAVALNILYGAGIINRLNMLRMQGIQLPPELWKIAPLNRDEIEQRVKQLQH
ncbi:2-nitropropane dioxygenase, NPD [Candidatus Vecturithrix granuli]|uniref:2-nitropropane dioxygenase, NPD n=1 Tax=Vecturithrix granuli TaxID=1499967 RepID=A0A081C719_VECG1|nr:2-nitropropane dioxygenase, NPD [Candidatus Vecturithrix granuli]